MAKTKNKGRHSKKGPEQQKKKSKPKANGFKRSKASTLLKNSNAALLKVKMNPFEVHINKQKFDVLGRKVKNDRGLPGVSRSNAVMKRNETLLQEYNVKDKSNKFMDRRIGEKNRAMTGEDRVMARFTAERMKSHNKKSMYNLADDEILTHHGQSINELEKFDDPRSDEEDDANSGKMDAKFVKEAHFGGGMFTKSGDALSRKDLIEQLIVDSKKRKADQKKAREETQVLTDKLDTEWKDLLPIIATSKRKPAEQKAAEPVEKPDDFDTTLRELRFEARGQPTDRLKSEEEIARQEKQRLEKLEAERLKRMHGITDKPKITHRSADDLDDGFDYNQQGQDKNSEHVLSYDADGQIASHDMDEDEERNGEVKNKSDEESASEEEEESSGDEEVDDLADLRTDSEEEEEENQDNEMDISQPTVYEVEDAGETLAVEAEVKSEVESDDVAVIENTESCGVVELKKEVKTEEEEQSILAAENFKKDLLARKLVMEQARKELPFTFKVPENYEDLQELMTDQSPDYQSVIVERIIKCNHPSLADGNKEKLASLLAFMLQHLHDVATEDDGECFVVLDRLAPHFFDLALISPQNARFCVAEVLREKQIDYRKRPTAFPSQDTLVFLKLVSLLFPTSDFRHPVCTPAFVFMCQLLDNCSVKSRANVSVGLFLSAMILEFTVLSKRFTPEVIVFLTKLLNIARLKRFSSTFNPTSVQSISISLKDLSVKSVLDETFQFKALSQAIKLLEDFRSNFEALPAAFQIFRPVLDVSGKLPEGLQQQLESLQAAIKSMGERKMVRLLPEAKKPKVLRLYEPKIEKVFDRKTHKVQGEEKQERAKLLHKLKHETKGAMREIRRDQTFIANLKFKQTRAADLERKRKVERIRQDIAEESRDVKWKKKK